MTPDSTSRARGPRHPAGATVEPRWPGLVVAALLAVVAVYGYQFRRDFIQSFFEQGRGGAPPPHLALPTDPALAARGLDRVDRVRVVLIDGVRRADAVGLPAYDQICAAGLDLTLDSGFPSVSLPIQRVLWSGLTQQQTGILFFNKKIPPPAVGIPGQVPGSVAVAESHQKIVHSMGFATALPAMGEVPDDWSLNASWQAWLDPAAAHGFERAATAAMAGDSRLAFVHILRTDSVAHRAGRVSEDYRQATRWGDRLLGELYGAERAAHPTGTRWFVMADHGHRDGGGHGGAEPWIRHTRLCIAGDVDRSARGSGYLHMVDLSRAIADSLGVRLDPAAAGRPMYAALAAPVQPDATLPRPGVTRWLIAGLLLALALGVTGWAVRRRMWALPWWWPLAYLGVIFVQLPPSLSTSMIYKTDAHAIYLAALPGVAWLAVTSALALRRLGRVRGALAQLALPIAGALAAMVLAGGIDAFTLADPPLMPRWTAVASVLLVFGITGAVVVVLALLLNLARASGSDTMRG